MRGILSKIYLCLNIYEQCINTTRKTSFLSQSGGVTVTDVEVLQQHPLVQKFALAHNDPELYQIIEKTNPTLKMLVDVASEIMEADR